jgi:hypothetical protein
MRHHLLRALPKVAEGGGSPVDWTFVGVGLISLTYGNPTPAIPSGTQEGDLLVSVLSVKPDPVINPPSGWTLATTQNQGSVADVPGARVVGGALAWIVRGASDPPTQWGAKANVSGDLTAAYTLAYRPSQGSVQFVAASSATAPSNSGSVETESILTVGPDNLIVACLCGADDGTTANNGSFSAANDPSGSSASTRSTVPNASTQPTRGAWVNRANFATSLFSDLSITVADAVRQTAGGTGTITAAHSISNARHAIVAAAFRAV